MARAWLTALVTALLLIPARAAEASPIEVFGFGSRQAARAGAAAATADDFAAGYYNPAGLAFGDRRRLTAGGLGAVSNLRVNDDRIELAEPLGLVVGVSAPAPLGGPLADRVHVGLGLYLLPRTVVRVMAHFPDEPFYPYYDNRTQRVVVLPTLAVRVRDDLAVGVAINFLASLGGQVVASEGATRALEARVDEEVASLARINAGVRWQPAAVPGLGLALAFRQRFEIPFSTVADTEVAGEPIALDISASGLFTPMQLVAGAAFGRGRADISADVTWARWSAYPGPFVKVRSELPLVGSLAGELPVVPYRDTIGVAVGGEVRVPGSGAAMWALRGGYRFETSPIPAQQSGVTNLLDGPKHAVSTGVGLHLARFAGRHDVRIDAHARAELVGGRTLQKRLVADGEPYDPFTSLRDEVADDPNDPSSQGVQVSNPGYPTMRSGGEVYSAGVTVEVSF